MATVADCIPSANLLSLTAALVSLSAAFLNPYSLSCPSQHVARPPSSSIHCHRIWHLACRMGHLKCQEWFQNSWCTLCASNWMLHHLCQLRWHAHLHKGRIKGRASCRLPEGFGPWPPHRHSLKHGKAWWSGSKPLCICQLPCRQIRRSSWVYRSRLAISSQME